MTHLDPLILTLGQAFKEAEAISRHFRRESGGSTYALEPFAYICLVAGAVALWWYLRERFERRAKKPKPSLVFRKVCRRFGLGWFTQRWLRRVAVHGQLQSPLTLLLSPATLIHHAGQYAQQLKPGAQRRLIGAVHDVQSRIFGQTAESTLQETPDPAED